MTKRSHQIFLCIPLLFAGLFGSEKEYASFPLENNVLTIDGLLDESFWSSAEFRSDFIQREPLENEIPSEKTEFSVCYDTDYLYVGIRAYSKNPNTIKGRLTRRDEWSPSDWLYIFIDSYNDNRTAFEFGLNPVGVKRDIRWSDDERADRNWDAVWEGGASLFEGGWSAEFNTKIICYTYYV